MQALVIVLERLEGSRLKFTTPYGDMTPALDRYAGMSEILGRRCGAEGEVTDE